MRGRRGMSCKQSRRGVLAAMWSMHPGSKTYRRRSRRESARVRKSLGIVGFSPSQLAFVGRRRKG